MRRSFRGPIVALSGALLLVALLVVPASARAPQAGSRADLDRVVAFWTKARIAAAKPRTMTLQRGARQVAGGAKLAVP